MQNENPISVGVCVMAYNHDLYLEQALDSVLMQKTNFPVMVYIGEDCSTDGTRDICLRYKEKYPDQITLMLNERNLGMRGNYLKTIGSVQEKYTAICESDDYWTDPEKLQKQVDFLEQNPDFAISSHHVDMLWFGIELRKMAPLKQNIFTVKDVIVEDWAMMTVSLVFRTDTIKIPTSFHHINNLDYVIQLLGALKGKIGYMEESMGVYRKHNEGISLKYTPLFLTISLSELFKVFNKETNNKYKKETRSKLLRMCDFNRKQAKNIGQRKHALILNVSYILMKYFRINILPILAKIPSIYDQRGRLL